MIQRFFILGVSALLLTLTFACKKHSEDMVSGTWELVNVADINDLYTYEWEFLEGELSIYRRSKSNTGNVIIMDTGFYVLESNPFKSRLRLLDTSVELWNNDWDVIKLNNSQLIIHMDIPGGVLLKEFVKIQ